jgi:hypothetical protein
MARRWLVPWASSRPAPRSTGRFGRCISASQSTASAYTLTYAMLRIEPWNFATIQKLLE